MTRHRLLLLLLCLAPAPLARAQGADALDATDIDGDEAAPDPEAKAGTGDAPTAKPAPTPEAASEKAAPATRGESKPTPAAKPSPGAKPPPGAQPAPGAKPATDGPRQPEAEPALGAEPVPGSEAAPSAKPGSPASPKAKTAAPAGQKNLPARSRWGASLHLAYVSHVWNRPYRDLSHDWFGDDRPPQGMAWRPRATFVLNPQGRFTWSLQGGLVYMSLKRQRSYGPGRVRLSFYRVAAEMAGRLLFPPMGSQGLRLFVQPEFMFPSHERTRLKALGAERNHKEMNVAFTGAGGVHWPLGPAWAAEALAGVNTLSEITVSLGGQYAF